MSTLANEASKAIGNNRLPYCLHLCNYLAMQIQPLQATVSYLTINLMVFWSKFMDNRGSITAFMVSQLIDVTIFHFLKNKTATK
jgi:hypothetical protein